MSVEFYRESPGKFGERTLSRETLSRWTGHILFINSVPGNAWVHGSGKSSRNLELWALQTSRLHPRSHWSQYAVTRNGLLALSLLSVCLCVLLVYTCVIVLYFFACFRCLLMFSACWCHFVD